MAAAYKLLTPFENIMVITQDKFLEEAVYRFSESEDEFSAIDNLKQDLIKWSKRQTKSNVEKIRRKLFLIIKLIDKKCAKYQYTNLHELYETCSSLNDLLKDQIIILPRFESVPMKMISKAIADKSGGYGFYGRHYAETVDVSGSIHNFFIFKAKQEMRPILNIPRYYREIQKHFENNKFQLKIGLFPLSNKNIYHIFKVEEEINENGGVFRIKEPLDRQEKILFERCKEALLECKKYNVDIAVFPEMLLTETIQKNIRSYVRKCNDQEGEFPRFIWLGTAWSNRRNKCIVIDGYGNVVFEQHKFIPYDYPKAIGENSVIRIREDLLEQECKEINFLEIPGFFRIATAICRDISDSYLTALLKEIHCDVVIIPAFSKSNRLVDREIKPLALEHVITVTCNACSSLCEEKQHNWQIGENMIGNVLPFCFVCMPGKNSEDNAAIVHHVCYNEKCFDCEQNCHGHFFTVSFTDCVSTCNGYSANVIY